MATRLSRAEQTERNRARVLAAARRVFLARGYHGATLDQIADEAGFSKGVVYSQFRNKADLFLALLETRIEERAAENAAFAEGLAGDEGMARMVDQVAAVQRAEADWALLVIEFRTHAARDPEVNRRYAEAHLRTLDELAGLIAALYDRAEEAPPLAPRQLAEVILALGAGVQLEQAADSEALQGPFVGELLTRLLTRPAAPATAPTA